MKVSVIIPVYNVADYLPACLDSVNRQSYRNLEIIIVNDGSTDNSLDICTAYATKDNRFRIISQKNGGLSSARNRGIREARGDIICFLDSDDYWEESDFIARLIQCFNDFGADAVEFRAVKVLEQQGARRIPDKQLTIPRKLPFRERLFHRDDFKILIRAGGLTACAWNKAIRRDIVLKNNLFFVEGITAEDIDWTCRLFQSIDSIVEINEYFYAYRKRPYSITSSFTVSKIRQLYRNLKVVESLKGESPAVAAYLSIQAAHFFACVAEMSNDEQRLFYPELKSLREHLALKATSLVSFVHYIRLLMGTNLALKLIHFIRKHR